MGFLTLVVNPLKNTWSRLMHRHWLQRHSTSYEIHHHEYLTKHGVQWHAKRFKEYKEEDLFNHPEKRLGEFLLQHPHVRDIAVDLGSGAGWLSALLSKEFKRVIAIEPSTAAVEIAKQLFTCEKYPNIEWHIGFAEDVLGTVRLDKPALFVTSTVLSHLTDKAVMAICAQINRIAPAGSLLNFAECWGPTSRDYLWYVRTPEWWRNQLRFGSYTFTVPPLTVFLVRIKEYMALSPCRFSIGYRQKTPFESPMTRWIIRT